MTTAIETTTTNERLDAARKQLHIKVIELNVDSAKLLLAENRHNRDIRDTHVKMLAGAIERGEWALNGESIKISSDGMILDGQHRILAVLECGLPIITLLIEGIDPTAQMTMDLGRARSLSDALKLNGETYYSKLAATLRAHYAYKRYGIPYVYGGNQVSPTTKQCIELLDEIPDIRDSVAYCGKLNSTLTNSGYAAALHYEFSKAHSHEDADDFMHKLATGIDLTSLTDPIYVLRKRLIEDQNPEHRPLRPLTRIAFYVIAFNAWISGEQINRLSWRAGGVNPDSFPTIITKD